MGKEIRDFTDLEVWKKAHQLVLEIYQITKAFPKEEIYGITNQIRRAATSVTANIAEGFSRYHYKEKVNFYYAARGSLSEVQNFLIIAKDLKLIQTENFQNMLVLIKEIQSLLNGLINSVKGRMK